LAPVDNKWKITNVTLRPRIEIATGDKGVAHELVEKAHAGCFIVRSVSCPVVTEPEIIEKNA
jgi:organic hydroperoxide reductase OsmC/OhrA